MVNWVVKYLINQNMVWSTFYIQISRNRAEFSPLRDKLFARKVFDKVFVPDSNDNQPSF